MDKNHSAKQSIRLFCMPLSIRSSAKGVGVRVTVLVFPVRFPHPHDPGDAGWHVDLSFPGEDCDPNEQKDFSSWRVNVISRGRALLMLFLFSDVGEQDARFLLDLLAETNTLGVDFGNSIACSGRDATWAGSQMISRSSARLPPASAPPAFRSKAIGRLRARASLRISSPPHGRNGSASRQSAFSAAATTLLS
jgi:hypothetical protein